MNAKSIAESGILVTLTLIILYAASIISISTLSILTVASCLIPISIIRTSIKGTILVYIASSILSFFLTPVNIAFLYTLFFGIYGIVKYFIEKRRNIVIEIFLKLLSFNILLSLMYFVISNFLDTFNIKSPIYLMWIAGQIGFLIYDYALTLIISFYLNRIHKHV